MTRFISVQEILNKGKFSKKASSASTKTRAQAETVIVPTVEPDAVKEEATVVEDLKINDEVLVDGPSYTDPKITEEELKQLVDEAVDTVVDALEEVFEEKIEEEKSEEPAEVVAEVKADESVEEAAEVAPKPKKKSKKAANVEG